MFIIYLTFFSPAFLNYGPSNILLLNTFLVIPLKKIEKKKNILVVAWCCDFFPLNLSISCHSLLLVTRHQFGLSSHYKNTPMQYTVIFHGLKNDNFQMKIVDYFLILLKTLIVGTR